MGETFRRRRHSLVNIDTLLLSPRSTVALRLAIGIDPLLKHGCDIHPLSSWDELCDRAEDGSFDLAFLDPGFPHGNGRPDQGILELEKIRSFSGAASLILYSQSDTRSLLLLQRIGFPFCVLEGIDDNPRSLLRVMARARSRGLFEQQLTLDELPIKAEDRDLFLQTISGWPPVQNVADLAGRFHLSARSLRRRTRASSLPNPQRLLRWGQLVEASVLWTLGLRPMTRIASVLGFASSSSMSRLCADLTDRPAKGLFGPDGPRTIIARMKEDLAA
jgi:AraC-like DNA-binding protein